MNNDEFFFPDLEDMGIEVPDNARLDVEEEKKSDPIIEEEGERSEREAETSIDNAEPIIEESEEEEEIEVDPSVFTPAYKYFKDQKYFPEALLKEKGEPTTPEEFLSLLDERNKLYEGEVLKEVHNYYVDKFPEPIKPLIDYIQKGGKIEEDKIVELVSSVYKNSYTEEELSDPEVASKYLVRKYAESGNFDQTAAENMIDALSDEDKVKAFQKAYSVEKESSQEKISKLNESRLKREEEQKRLGGEFISNLNSLNWKPAYKGEIKDFVTKGEFKSKLEALTRDPRNLHLLAEFVKHYDSEKGFNLNDYLKLKGKDGGVRAAKKNINKYFESTPKVTKDAARNQRAINVDKIIGELEL